MVSPTGHVTPWNDIVGVQEASETLTSGGLEADSETQAVTKTT